LPAKKIPGLRSNTGQTNFETLNTMTDKKRAGFNKISEFENDGEEKAPRDGAYR